MRGKVDLDHAALCRDLSGAQRALGLTLEMREEREAQANVRVALRRTFRIAMPSKIRARFVRQGVVQQVKKLFTSEVEVGEPSFDDLVYIATDTPDEVRKLLAIERAREAIATLVGKYCAIDVTETEIVVVQDDTGGPSDDEAAEVVALAACAMD